MKLIVEVITHDAPVLFVQLIEDKPWIRRTRSENHVRVFEGSEWMVSNVRLRTGLTIWPVVLKLEVATFFEGHQNLKKGHKTLTLIIYLNFF